jgi:hypothetical protein
MLITRRGINERIDRFSRLTAAIDSDESLSQIGSPLQLTRDEAKSALAIIDGAFYDSLSARARTTIILRLDSLLAEGGASYDFPRSQSNTFVLKRRGLTVAGSIGSQILQGAMLWCTHWAIWSYSAGRKTALLRIMSLTASNKRISHTMGFVLSHLLLRCFSTPSGLRTSSKSDSNSLSAPFHSIGDLPRKRSEATQVQDVYVGQHHFMCFMRSTYSKSSNSW